jgi:hypothetical protein
MIGYVAMDPNAVKEDRYNEPWTRNILAFMVFFVSAVGILGLAYYSMKADASFEKRQQIFNIIVPVFSTWVGTILAYYFAKENFEAANRNAQQLAEKFTPEQRLQQVNVRDAMTPKADIKGITLDKDSGDAGVTLADILKYTAAGSSRVPIFNADNSIKYVLHESVLKKYTSDATAAAGVGLDVIQQKTLNDLLNEDIADKGKTIKIREIAVRFAVVSATANLANARDAMVAVPGALDVFVTADGKATSAVTGWLTSTAITRDVNLS